MTPALPEARPTLVESDRPFGPTLHQGRGRAGLLLALLRWAAAAQIDGPVDHAVDLAGGSRCAASRNALDGRRALACVRVGRSHALSGGSVLGPSFTQHPVSINNSKAAGA